MSWHISQSLSSVSPSSSSSSSSSSVSADRDGARKFKCDSDTNFAQFIMESKHAAIVDLKGQIYDVYIDCHRLHWFLLLKMKGTPDEIGYFTLEISTPDLCTIQKEMYEYDSLPQKGVVRCGIIEGHSLRSIIEVADRIPTKMGSYSLFSSNCQHFCNNFLNHYKLKIYRTTLGKNVTVTIQNSIATNKVEEEALSLLVKELKAHQSTLTAGEDPYKYSPNSQLSHTEAAIRGSLARVLNKYVGAV